MWLFSLEIRQFLLEIWHFLLEIWRKKETYCSTATFVEEDPAFNLVNKLDPVHFDETMSKSEVTDVRGFLAGGGLDDGAKSSKSSMKVCLLSLFTLRLRAAIWRKNQIPKKNIKDRNEKCMAQSFIFHKNAQKKI